MRVSVGIVFSITMERHLSPMIDTRIDLDQTCIGTLQIMPQ